MRVVDMVTEAAAHLGRDGKAFSNNEVREWIGQRWPDTNPATVNCTLLLCSVNAASRLHYPENQKVRLQRHPDYDTLYRVGHGQYVLYDQQLHGTWRILKKDGQLKVTQVQYSGGDSAEPKNDEGLDDSERARRGIEKSQQELGAFIADGGDIDSAYARDLKRSIEWNKAWLATKEGHGGVSLTWSEVSLLREIVKAYVAMVRSERTTVEEQGSSEEEARAWDLVRRLWA